MPPSKGYNWGDLWKDVYQGDGYHDSLMVRVSLLEEKVDRINKGLSRLFWVSLGTLLTILGDILSRNFFK